MKTNKSMQIAFVCDNLRNNWLDIAENMFFDKGYFVSHCYSRDGGEFIQMLIEGRFDGVFMLSNRYTASELNEIASAGIPIVLYKTRDYSFLESNIVTVAPDIYGGIRKAVNFLIVKGHERIIFAPPLRYNMNLKKGFRERAYKDALEENGIPMRRSLSAGILTLWKQYVQQFLIWSFLVRCLSVLLLLLPEMIIWLRILCSI